MDHFRAFVFVVDFRWEAVGEEREERVVRIVFDAVGVDIYSAHFVSCIFRSVWHSSWLSGLVGVGVMVIAEKPFSWDILVDEVYKRGVDELFNLTF